MISKHTIVLCISVLVTAGCTRSVVEEEKSDASPSVKGPASSQQDVREPNDEFERADSRSELRAVELAKSLVIAREGWPNARCVSTRKQNGWSVLLSRNPRERFADDVVIEVSHDGDVITYRYAR